MFSRLARLTTVALLAARSASAISWAMIFSNDNVWDELEYSTIVPQGPSSAVTTGPWFFWCGLQPENGGVVQPVLQWGQATGSYVDPTPSFPQIWAMILWTVPADGFNDNNALQSPGVWAAQGDVFDSFVTYNNNQWIQTSRVTSGQAAGLTTTSTIEATQYFDVTSTGGSQTNFFVCESELDGQQTADWNFNVTFTNVNVRAQTSDGVSALCSSQTSHSDGNGFVTLSGFSMINATTCHWDTVTLTPP